MKFISAATVVTERATRAVLWRPASRNTMRLCASSCASSCAAHTHGAPALFLTSFSLIHGLRAAGCGEVCVPQLVVRLSRGVVWVRLS